MRSQKIADGRALTLVRAGPKEALNKFVCCVVRQACPEYLEGLTTNEINYLPFVLSLSKDLFSVSLVDAWLKNGRDFAARQHDRVGFHAATPAVGHNARDVRVRYAVVCQCW